VKLGSAARGAAEPKLGVLNPDSLVLSGAVLAEDGTGAAGVLGASLLKTLKLELLPEPPLKAELEPEPDDPLDDDPLEEDSCPRTAPLHASATTKIAAQ
jgi:hypothetical protein